MYVVNYIVIGMVKDIVSLIINDIVKNVGCYIVNYIVVWEGIRRLFPIEKSDVASYIVNYIASRRKLRVNYAGNWDSKRYTYSIRRGF